MGGKISKKLHVDHKGKRIYVCCAGCIDAVQKDPAKYIRRRESKGFMLGAVPSKKVSWRGACQGKRCAKKDTAEK